MGTAYICALSRLVIFAIASRGESINDWILGSGKPTNADTACPAAMCPSDDPINSCHNGIRHPDPALRRHTKRGAGYSVVVVQALVVPSLKPSKKTTGPLRTSEKQ